jgi:hypothetical protein
MTRFTDRVERDLAQIADRASPSSTAWEAIQHRIDEQDTTESTMEVIMLSPDDQPSTRSRSWIYAAAAVAAVALVGGLIAISSRDTDSVPANQPQVTVPTSIDPDSESNPEAAAAEDLPPTPAEALSAADEYFAANASGDFGELRALFTTDATFGNSFSFARDEPTFEWNAAQGTAIASPDCTVTGQIPAESVTVTCTSFNLDALVQAVAGPAVPITLKLSIGPDGITDELGWFVEPDFKTVSEPFEAWMRANYPEGLDRVGFAKWTSIEEAQENGVLIAQYAQTWAEYLDANGCTYSDGC